MNKFNSCIANLEHYEVARICKECGVGASTMKLYLKDPYFEELVNREGKKY